MFFFKLKLSYSFKALATIFDVGQQICSNNFRLILKSLSPYKSALIKWQTKKQIAKLLPDCFKYYPDTRIIIIFLELPVQSPSKQSEQKDFYSHHQRRHTVKFMMGIAPNGFISFVTKVYPGSVCNSVIFSESNIVNQIDEGDRIMVYKDFPEVELQKEIVTIIPDKIENNQARFSKEELEECKRISSVRIHVNQFIERMQIFEIVNNEIPRTLLPYISDIIAVCAMSLNLYKPINSSSSDD